VGRQICAAGARTPVPKREHEKQDQQLGAPAKAKRKTRRPSPADLRFCPSDVKRETEGLATTLGRPLVSVGFAGCHVPVDRRQHTGESR
jgi:hypothetical protein